MMMNLFSIFDPSVYYYPLSWISFMLVLMFFWLTKYFFNGMGEKMKNLILLNMLKEQKLLISSMSLSSSMLLLSVFFFLLTNSVSLSLFIFTPNTHLTIVLPLSLVCWLSLTLWGILSYIKEFIMHLVPIGTPFLLLSFMVVIELVSSLIRPITLTIRLISNMLAGHLMMSLVGSALLKFNFSSKVFLFFTMVSLSILELAVSVIQAYVFTTLLTLYLSEVI